MSGAHGFARVRDGIRLNSLVSDIVPAGEDSWWLGTRGEGLFLCELGLVATAPVWLAATVLLLLFAVFAAMARVGLAMTMGRPVARPRPLPRRLLVVPGILFAVVVVGGLAACGVCASLVLKGGYFL